ARGPLEAHPGPGLAAAPPAASLQPAATPAPRQPAEAGISGAAPRTAPRPPPNHRGVRGPARRRSAPRAASWDRPSHQVAGGLPASLGPGGRRGRHPPADPLARALSEGSRSAAGGGWTVLPADL